MAGKSIQDMTRGNISLHLLKFSIPLLIGNVFQQLYNMVDSIIVGRYVGSHALAAVGSVGSLNFLFFSLCIGLANGIGILVSQFFGAKKEKTTRKYIAHAVYVTLGSGALMSVIGASFARPILRMMNTPPEIFEDALLYMHIVCGCTIIIAVYNCISAILRALGDSRTPLVFLIVASIVNILLDLIFVIFFNLGVAGVAIATVFSQAISAIGSILWGIKINPYLRLKKDEFKLDLGIIKKEVMMGIPLAAQSASIAFSCVALQGIVNTFGATVVAAYTATNRVEQIVQQPFNSLCMALSTFAGQNFGAKNKERIMGAAKRATIANIVFSLVMIAVMFFFADAIVGIFIKDIEVIEIGTRGLRVTSYMYILLGFIYVMRGLLNGVGDVGFSMLNGFSEVACRILGAIFFVYILGMDYMAVWYTNGFTWGVAGLLCVIRFLMGKWKKMIDE